MMEFQDSIAHLHWQVLASQIPQPCQVAVCVEDTLHLIQRSCALAPWDSNGPATAIQSLYCCQCDKAAQSLSPQLLAAETQGSNGLPLDLERFLVLLSNAVLLRLLGSNMFQLSAFNFRMFNQLSISVRSECETYVLPNVSCIFTVCLQACPAFSFSNSAQFYSVPGLLLLAASGEVSARGCGKFLHIVTIVVPVARFRVSKY